MLGSPGSTPIIPLPAAALFALAVLSKEHVAAVAAVGFMLAGRPRHRRWRAGAGAAVALLAVYWLRSRVAAGWPVVPVIDNPASILPAGQRILTALWVQCLYIWKTFVPITLSADYSYKQIPLVMGLTDPRAWAGLALAVTSVAAACRVAVPRDSGGRLRVAVRGAHARLEERRRLLSPAG